MAACFLLEVLMFGGVLSMCVWHFVQIFKGRGRTKVYILYTILKVLVATLAFLAAALTLGDQFTPNLVQQSQLVNIVKFLMTILVYLGLIYAIEVQPIIKYLELVLVVDSHVFYQIGTISEMTHCYLVLALSILISLIACRNQKNSSFSRRTKMLSSINLIFLSLTHLAMGISDGLLFVFLNMFAINLSLVFVEPELPSGLTLSEEDSVIYVESAVSTMSIDSKYN